jgi:hypothetical protein
MGFVPVVPPGPKRREPWALDKAQYRRLNEVESLFRRLKVWRRVFMRYDKTDVMFAAFITAALIAEALRQREHDRPEGEAGRGDVDTRMSHRAPHEPALLAAWG